MAPVRGLNLKKLFGKLTPYADDVARGVSSYGDDALRLASNYGDSSLDYGLDVAKYADVLDNSGRALMSPELLGDDFLDAVDDYAKLPRPDAFIRSAPHDAHVNAYVERYLRNEAAASNILENAAKMRLDASDATADALTRLNRKYPTVYDWFYDPDAHESYEGLAVGPFTDVLGYVDHSNPSVAHAGNRKLKALYEKLGLDRYGYEPDELPF